MIVFLPRNHTFKHLDFKPLATMNSFSKFSLDIQKEYETPIMTSEHSQDIEFDPSASISEGYVMEEKQKNEIIRSNQDNEHENSLQLRKEKRKRGKSPVRPKTRKNIPRKEKQRKEKSPKRQMIRMSNLEVYYNPNPPPELPERHMQALQDFAQGQVIEELQLVMQKKMFFSDLNPNHNRLSMPIRQLRYTFLIEDEIHNLELREERGVRRMEVDVIDPLLDKSTLSLRRWAMKKEKGNPSVTYVLTEKWNNIVKKNSLKELDILQVYTVRVDRKLWFLLVKLPNDNNPTLPPPNTEEEEVGPSRQRQLPKLLNLFPNENSPTFLPNTDDPDPRSSEERQIPKLLQLFS